MKKENGNQKEVTMDFEIKMMEAEILGLRGRHREEAITAYRKLLVASTEKPVYFRRY